MSFTCFTICLFSLPAFGPVCFLPCCNYHVLSAGTPGRYPIPVRCWTLEILQEPLQWLSEDFSALRHSRTSLCSSKEPLSFWSELVGSLRVVARLLLNCSLIDEVCKERVEDCKWGVSQRARDAGATAGSLTGAWSAVGFFLLLWCVNKEAMLNRNVASVTVYMFKWLRKKNKWRRVNRRVLMTSQMPSHWLKSIMWSPTRSHGIMQNIYIHI